MWQSIWEFAMIISEKQIMTLIQIANAHMANAFKFGEYQSFKDVQDLLFEINNQQSEELKVIE